MLLWGQPRLASQATAVVQSVPRELMPLVSARPTGPAQAGLAAGEPSKASLSKPSAPKVSTGTGEKVGATGRSPLQPPKAHVVKQGETLWDVASRYGITVAALMAANDLQGDLIRPGQVLRVPAPGAASAQPKQATVKASPSGQRIVHTVRSGETLWDIAQRYGVTIDAIGQVNSLPDPDRLQQGQRLVIPLGNKIDTASWDAPTASGTVYVVGPGDTLSGIARRYGVAIQTLAAANGLENIHYLRVGQRLTIPGPGQSVRVDRLPRVSGFVWPSRGRITSGFGRRWRRHHSGIDLAAPTGTPVYAAKGGRVIFAGWYYGYGRTVIIDHGGGMTTLYAHASRLLVRSGQVVRQGQLIAHVGRTGVTTGPHLHFEVRINGTPVNPLRYLQ